MTFDKTALLAALKPVVTDVQVDGFGLVHVRQLSVAENDAVRAAAKKEAAPSAFGLQLLVASVVDEEGAAVFDATDVAELNAASGSKIDVLINKVLEVNGFKTGATEKN